MWDDGNSFGPKEVHSYLTRVMYNRRNKFNPLWNSLVLGGVKNGQKYLGTVNMIGVHYQDNHVATGFGNHLAVPILRDGWREDLTFEEGVRLLEKCLRVLLYRDRSAVNKLQGKLFGVWLKLYKMRYAIAEKRMKVERIKQKIKLLKIVCQQLDLLSELDKLEKKNCEAVSRVTRKRSAFSTKLPLVNGATVNIVSVFEAMSLALEVMENIEERIINFHFQAEKVCKLRRELIHTVQQNTECFPELEKEITSIISLEGQEKSLVVHIVQANGEAEEGQMNCKHDLMRFFRNRDTSLVFSMLNVS